MVLAKVLAPMPATMQQQLHMQQVPRQHLPVDRTALARADFAAKMQRKCSALIVSGPQVCSSLHVPRPHGAAGMTSAKHCQVTPSWRRPGNSFSASWRSGHPPSTAGNFQSLRRNDFSQVRQRCGRAWAAAQGTQVAFTIPDEELTKKGLQFRTDYQGIDLDKLNDLFGKVGFPRRTNKRLLLALENTPHIIWLEDVDTSELVAFARATGDGVFNAIIWDVVVDPKMQGLGLGKAIMERLLKELLDHGICNIALYAESQVVQFYKPLGFMVDPGDMKGMALRKKTK